MRLTLAATALLASTTLANAQALTIGGEGRMGIWYESVSIGGVSTNAWAQENRLVLHFNVAVQADHGLSFGAYSRVQINNGSTGRFSGSHVFVEASNFRLSFGNLDGAIISAGVANGYPGCGIGYIGGQYCGDSAGLVGLFTFALGGPPVDGILAAAQAQEFDYTGGGNPSMLRIDYSFGDVRVALSHQRNGATELGVHAAFDAFSVALGYSNRAAITTAINPFGGALVPGNVVTLSGHYNGGTWGVRVIAARVSYSGLLSAFDHTNYSLAGNVELGGGSLYAYVGRVHGGVLNTIPLNTAGISYGYGLGGGATLTGGLERISGGGGTWTSMTVGVAFTF